ncbi:NAD(+)/NADH kinase [Candidatus Microgenomates bacterium]|nr:NAD(+)/NADH kinase [Candidatus Microgenomates bacterium]
MKVLLHGKYSKNIEPLVKSLGFEVVTSNPEVVISYGGDGTLLSSERHYPGIPKLPIRNSLIYKKCPEHKEEVLLKTLSQNKLQVKEYAKLETKVENQTILALNDFVIRNKEAVHAIRFQVTVPSHPERLRRHVGGVEGSILIGDGVVLATPFGSTGYFKSITGQTFQDDFGLAFNNTTQKIEPIIFKDDEEITFKLIRGHGTLTHDNSHSQYAIKEGAKLTFKQSLQKAKIYEAGSLRCPNCQVIRG